MDDPEKIADSYNAAIATALGLGCTEEVEALFKKREAELENQE